MTKKRVTLVAAVSLILISGIVIGFGLFPVARVGKNWILYRDLGKLMNAAQTYQAVVREKDPGIPGFDSLSNDSERGILEEMVVQKIVESQIPKFRHKNIEGQIESDLSRVLSSVDRQKIEEASTKLYGLRFEEFKKYIILPQVREIVLRRMVEDEGREFGPWLEAEAKNTPVSIFVLSYRWTGTGLENK